MTRDDIMALVNQTAGQHWMDEAHIQRFAALLIAAEREACAQLCESCKWEDNGKYYAAGIRARGEV